jgi:Domain of unknown function (DUF4337)
MILSQQQASDQWAFYQAKALREHLCRNQRSYIEIELFERGSSMKPEARKEFESMVKTLADEEARYGSEKKEIEKEAKELERERDEYRSKDPYFDYGEVLLQIAIVMASISIISGSRPVFYFSIISALLGTVSSINGFLLLFRIPFFH